VGQARYPVLAVRLLPPPSASSVPLKQPRLTRLHTAHAEVSARLSPAGGTSTMLDIRRTCGHSGGAETGKRRIKIMAKMCVCGHDHDVHFHFRRGADCGRCGRVACPEFREVFKS
jgi:hypothetical protein